MKKTRRLAPPLIALMLVALTLAACGSSDDGSSSSSDKSSGGSADKSSGASSDGLSKAELVDQADKICDDVGTRVKALPTPKSLPEVQSYTEAASQESKEGVARLKELTPADDVKSDYDAFTKLADNVTKQAAVAAEAASSQDAGKMQEALKTVLEQGAETRRLAQKIGFRKCGLSALSGAPPTLPGAPQAPAAP